ncbi:MAG: hypothetical protein H6Q17_356 [Bacteroidetes bacterium]|nr:hypothetical protein [Bacteroidota bacterium]
MAKHKKKKPLAPVKRGFAVTKTYFDQFSEVARKMLRLSDLDPSLFDSFSKKQKLDMMALKAAPPRVSIVRDSLVPRSYIRIIQANLTAFQKENYVRGNSSIALTFYDLMTMGVVFIAYLEHKYPPPYINLSDARVTIAKRISEVTACAQTHFMRELQQHFQLIMIGLSKMNFRLYAYQFSWSTENRSDCFISWFRIEAISADVKVFRHNGVERSAFRMGIATLDNRQIAWLSFPANRIIEGCEATRQLKVYVQNHALQRLKERMDTLNPFFRNLVLVDAILGAEIVDAVNGQKLLVCSRREKEIVGYLPFTVQNDCLLILSFLPISSWQTPEGSRLYKAVNLSKDDAIFLGMDKLSFFQKTDFDAIPLLKNALQEAGMWHLTNINSSDAFSWVERKKSAIIARFFEQDKQPDRAKILDEIALDD